MQKGINRALKNEAFYENTYDEDKKCVFISHKSEDKKEAIAIGEEIKKRGIDIYLDIYDADLQYATKSNDSRKIVRSIEKALSVSTHILVYITENTKDSWWVPYEIGYSKRGNIEVASLLNIHEKDFPDYLKIEKTLRTIKEFDEYLDNIKCGLSLSFISENSCNREITEFIRSE